MKKLSVLSVNFLCATEVFAWHGRHGDGRRLKDDPKITAPTDSNTKTESPDGSVILNANFSNRRGEKELICDFIGRFSAKRGGDETTVTAFETKIVVKPYRAFTSKFFFELPESMPGFEIDKKSQEFHASCLMLEIGEDPKTAPNPHEKCDPEFEDCDWTCKANQSNPDQCADPGQDWPSENNKW